MRPLLLLVLLVFLVGCNTVASRQLVGSQPCPIEDAAAWTGHWLVVSDGSPQPIVIQVADAAAGIVRVTYIQTPLASSGAEPPGVGSYPTVASFLVHLRKEGDVVVGNMHAIEEFALADKASKIESQDEYLWFRLTLGDKGPAAAILPNAERVGELVEAKELRGTKKDGSVVLEGLSAEEFSKLAADAGAFHYATPLALIKLPAE